MDEVHLFSYLACLLSLYDGRRLESWGYSFSATVEGAPFSSWLDGAIEASIRRGDISQSENTMRLTSLGMAERTRLQSLEILGGREIFIESSCSSLLLVPIGMVRRAVWMDRNIQSSHVLQTNRWLFDLNSAENLDEDFTILREELGHVASDLLTASVIWLTQRSSGSAFQHNGPR
jgi:hypothetical protein